MSKSFEAFLLHLRNGNNSTLKSFHNAVKKKSRNKTTNQKGNFRMDESVILYSFRHSYVFCICQTAKEHQILRMRIYSTLNGTCNQLCERNILFYPGLCSDFIIGSNRKSLSRGLLIDNGITKKVLQKVPSCFIKVVSQT